MANGTTRAAVLALSIISACQQRGTSETSEAPPPSVSEGDLVALCTSGTHLDDEAILELARVEGSF